jgi:H/ACA ribonucleoprotein complex subunit 4
MSQDFMSDGLIILDKPPGHTSHEISAFVRKITGAKRAGHAGTLDPEVSGVLPVAVGRSTKLLRYIAGKDKTYVGIIKFRRIQTRGEIEKLFKKFTGELTQTPPKMSAVRKVPRKRTVYHLRLLEISETNPRLAVFEAKVGAGTYIRTLCEDMGKECGGARMEELRRIAVGRIKEGLAVTLEDLVDAVWLMKNRNDDSAVKKIVHPTDEFIDLPKAIIKETAIGSVRSGAQIGVPAMISFDSSVKRGDHIKIYSEGGRFVGVGIAQIPPEELSSLRKGIAIKLERVQIQ